VSIKTLHEETDSLTFNQLAIESTRGLVQSIINNESKDSKNFSSLKWWLKKKN
jgi:hypothetical protein